jgi:hypothetical protein
MDEDVADFWQILEEQNERALNLKEGMVKVAECRGLSSSVDKCVAVKKRRLGICQETNPSIGCFDVSIIEPITYYNSYGLIGEILSRYMALSILSSSSYGVLCDVYFVRSQVPVVGRHPKQSRSAIRT